MNRPPAFQFYPKDWLDFRVQRMSLAAQGAYLKLLCFMWKDSQDQCSIINDDRAIATAIGVPCEVWKGLREEIQFPGDPILQDDGRFLRSGRLKQEAEKQQNYARQQAEKGKQGAQKRWNKLDSHGHSTGHDAAIAQGMAVNGSSSSSSEIKKERRDQLVISSGKKRNPPTKTPLPEGFTISDEVWEWTAGKQYPREFVEHELEKFCNRNRATGETHVDWDAAFRNWLIKAHEFSTSRNGHPVSPRNDSRSLYRERIPL